MKRHWIIGGFGAAALVAAAFGMFRNLLTGQPISVLSEPVVTSGLAVSAQPMRDTSDVGTRVETLQTNSRRYAPIDTSVFIDQPRFVEAWSEVQPPTLPKDRVIAGLVNHHVLASDLLARFFRGLKRARPDAKRFIIISPDHFHAGRTDISTHDRAYRVGTQLVSVDTSGVRLLTQDGLVAGENGVMYEREHGIGALIPFLVHEFPDATVVPLSMRSSMERSRAKLLGERLASLLDVHTVVVVSSDMSHYLHEDVALTRDVSTLRWLKTLDTAQFEKASDGYLDTGVALVAVSSMIRALQVSPRFTLFDHSISSRYGGPKDNTTSYFTGVWTE